MGTEWLKVKEGARGIDSYNIIAVPPLLLWQQGVDLMVPKEKLHLRTI